MPDWASALIKDLLAPTGIVALAFGWWFKARRDDRKEKEAAEAAERKAEKERTERLEGKVESLLHDAAASARELNAQLMARIDMDEKQNTVLNAASEALTENAKVLARLEPILAKLMERKS